MAPELLPENPLQFIRKCVREGRVLWTYHVNMRLSQRAITRRMIVESIEVYEVLETYPRDKYLPSILVWSQQGGDIFHILFAVDVTGDNVRIVTAYRPDPLQWDADLKTRRLS